MCHGEGEGESERGEEADNRVKPHRDTCNQSRCRLTERERERLNPGREALSDAETNDPGLQFRTKLEEFGLCW